MVVRQLVSIIFTVALLFAIPASVSNAAYSSAYPDSGDRVQRGYYTSGTHYRSTYSSSRLLWSNIHYAILNTCDYGSSQLATPAQTRSWTNTPSSSPSTHQVNTQSGLKKRGTLNAGSHHFVNWDGQDLWSPGGADGWDRCWS